MKIKYITILSLIILSSCHYHKNNQNCELNRPISHFFINSKKFFFKKNTSNNSLLIDTKTSDNISIEKPKVSLKNDKKYILIKNEYNFSEQKFEKENNSILKVNLVDQERKREPFEDPQETSEVRKNAMIEVGYQKRDQFSLVVRSNIANVRFDPQNQNNRLDLQFNNQINNLNFEIKVNF
jgi:hypothetical protein